jgi:predicted nucleic acid-binding Zn ribbon protein
MAMGKKKTVYKFICKHCGKEFERTGHDKHNSKFCSVECSRKFHSGKNHPLYKPLDIMHCTECGKSFEQIHSVANRKYTWGSFCSPECRSKWQSKNIVLDKHPLWQGGKSFEPYCPLFNETFKERVRAFFDYTCQLCGSPQGKERLHVHHIVYNKQTCCDDSPKMFVPLCRSCHTKTNHNRDTYTEKFTKLITEKYNGRSYFTVEEWNELNQPHK